MDSYLSLMILSYFKNNSNYSILELNSLLGISGPKVIRIIDNLLEQGFLDYQNNIVKLTQIGRLKLQNKEEDFYSFDYEDIEHKKINKNKAWDVKDIYVPLDFDKKV